jgi:hypothetical protein
MEPAPRVKDPAPEEAWAAVGEEGAVEAEAVAWVAAAPARGESVSASPAEPRSLIRGEPLAAR